MSAPTVFKGREVETTEQALASAMNASIFKTDEEVDEDIPLVKSDIAASGGAMPSDDPGVKRKRGRPSKKAALAAKKLKLSASTDASTGPIEAVENPGQPAEADGDLSSRYDTPLGSTPESPTPLRKTLRKTPAVGKFSTSASTSTRSSTRAGNVSNNAKGPRYSEDDNDTDDDTVDESKENREKSPQPIQAPKKRGRGRPRKSQTPLPSGKAAAGKAVAGKSKDGRRRTSARQSVLLANRQQEEDKLRATRASAKTTTRARKTPAAHGRGVARVKKASKKSKDGNRSFSQKEYHVERIVDSMIDADTKEHLYQVKWTGYPSKDNTWEPKSNLENCKNLVKDYDAKQGKSKK